MWRLQRDALRCGEPNGLFNGFGLFAPHVPVRFDMHHVSAQADGEPFLILLMLVFLPCVYALYRH